MDIEQQEKRNEYLENRGCKRKRSYSSRSVAKKVARKMSLKYRNGRMAAYKCDFCTQYHIGHNNFL